jgi:Htaa
MVRPRSLAALIVLLVLAAVASLATVAAPAGAAVHAITDGTLKWDLKQSWREYIGDGSKVGDGATITGWAEKPSGGIYPKGFEFPVASGSFDDATNTTTLQLEGWVHFQAWYGILAPDKYALDTKFSDLEVVIGPTEQVLRGTHTGYLRTDPGGELHEDADVVLTKLDIGGATTSFAGGQSKWTAIPTVAGPGFSIYGESSLLDPTSFEYTGPGGIPDLSEKFDAPGTPGLQAGASWLADPATGARVLHASQSDVVHTVDLVAPGTVDAKLVVAAYDATTLAPVGTPYTWAFPGALANDQQELRTAFDPETDSIFFASFNEGAARNQASVQRVVWDPVGQDYDHQLVGELGVQTASRRVFGLAWNPVKDELAAIAYLGSTADKYQADSLHRFHLDAGTWVHEQTPLRLPDDGVWAGASAVVSPFASGTATDVDDERLAVASDGSYVGAPREGRATVAGVKNYYPALHIKVAGDGTAAVEPIAGTTTPRTAFGTYYGFGSLVRDVDGSLLVHNSDQVMDAYARIGIVAGEAVKTGGIFDAPEDAYAPYELAGFANSMAADATRGRVWATDTFNPKGFRLHALVNDEVVASYVFSEFPETSAAGSYSRLELAPDGSVYLPIKDSGTGRLGYRRLAYTGIVPKVTTQPQPQAVVLGVGEQTEQAQFTVAIANGADSIQWQASAPGQAAFTDLAGKTGTTLSVDATRVLDGTVYRAKVTNAAGKVVSNEAELDVDYAPVIVTDLANRTVTEGTDAVFLLSADSDPEADVEWQRRVSGFWQAIAPGDENFVLTDSSLTVLDTNTEQSGARFRAKLTNPIGSVYAKEVKLTVEPAVEIPEDGIDVEHATFDWTGNPEMQKAPPFGGNNYFSAGISSGNEATYSAATGNARVFQVQPGGAATLATYATRAAHVGSVADQLVRLYEGSGRIEPDGSATVAWDAEFSVNFYGGLVPFTFVDPVLEVDADGDGTLSAEMRGCASAKDNPNICTPMAPKPGVTVATFSGVEIEPSGEVVFAPDYAGVEVEVPSGIVPQNRGVAGWGAWPQPFVDFQIATGLNSYWYSSGGAFDPDKPANDFLVDFAGELLPAPPAKPAPPVSPPPASDPAPSSIGALRKAQGTRHLSGKRVVRAATAACLPGGTSCTVTVPPKVYFTLDGKRHWAKVLAPKQIGAGAAAQIWLKLSKGAMRALGDGSVVVQVPVELVSADQTIAGTAKIRIKG